MTIDMPPQIPPAIIEYVNKHDYIPDGAKEASLSEFINECRETYNGYKIYRLGVIDRLDSGAVGYKYKNCYLLLSNKKETRCATEEEEKDIIYHYPNLSKQYAANIPLDVVKFARFYGETPKNYDPAEYNNVEYIVPDFDYFHSKPIIRKGYASYFLAFPYVYRYTKDRCQIVMHNDSETRCATEDEHMEIMVIEADSSKISGAVFNYVDDNDNWFNDKLKKTNTKNDKAQIYLTHKCETKFNNYDIYFVCYGNPDKKNIKRDKCIIVLDNSKEIRCATEDETKKIKKLRNLKFK